MKIVNQVRKDIFTCYDLVSKKEIKFHIDRLRVFHKGNNINEEQLLKLAAKDKDEYIVDNIVDFRGNLNGPRSKLEFRVRWKGYDDSEDTWLPYRNVRDLAALDIFAEDKPELKRRIA
jgi:hypothetical protein